MIKDQLRVVDFHREQRNLEDAFIDILANLEKNQPALATPPPRRPASSPPSPPTIRNLPLH